MNAVPRKHRLASVKQMPSLSPQPDPTGSAVVFYTLSQASRHTPAPVGLMNWKDYQFHYNDHPVHTDTQTRTHTVKDILFEICKSNHTLKCMFNISDGLQLSDSFFCLETRSISLA